MRCESCRHCVLVVDHAGSCSGSLRVLSVCVADHDLEGEDYGDVVTDDEGDCPRFEEDER